jgi:lysophospholipase L1-like esterase
MSVADADEGLANPRRRWRGIRVGVAIIGVTAVAISLLRDFLLPGGDAGFGTGQLLLLALGIACLGIAALGHRAPGAYRGSAILLANTLVLLTVIEIAATAALSLPTFGQAKDNRLPTDLILRSQWYAGRDWTEQFVGEFRRASRGVRYTPFTLSRLAPFSGRFVNVDSNGTRFTPGADCGPDAYTVFVFGGSAVWGWGVTDSATIPALLQRLWPARDGGTCVRNFGQLGHVSTQETIELLRQLQKSNIPDLAIFYSGHNDLHSAAEQGVAGSHMRAEAAARAFEEQPASGPSAGAIDLLTKTATFRLVSSLVLRGTSDDSTRSAPIAGSLADHERLGDEVAQVFITNVRTVAALARDFGFDYAIFWQPELARSAKARTEEERAVEQALTTEYLTMLGAGIKRFEAARASLPNVYDLSDVFDNETDQIFIDHVHISPRGNEIVARRLLERLQSAPSKQRQPEL